MNTDDLHVLTGFDPKTTHGPDHDLSDVCKLVHVAILEHEGVEKLAAQLT